MTNLIDCFFVCTSISFFFFQSYGNVTITDDRLQMLTYTHAFSVYEHLVLHFSSCLLLFFSLQTLLMVVVFTIVAVSQGQRLRNTKLLFNGWVSYDFSGKWGGGLGAVLKFKRSTDAVRIKTPSLP